MDDGMRGFGHRGGFLTYPSALERYPASCNDAGVTKFEMTDSPPDTVNDSINRIYEALDVYSPVMPPGLEDSGKGETRARSWEQKDHCNRNVTNPNWCQGPCISRRR